MSVQLGDIGVAIELTITNQDGTIVDMSSATSHNIVLKKPSQATVTKAASFTTDGTDGKIQYVTVADDLDEVGIWYAQADVAVATFDGRSIISEFRVRANL